MKIAVILSGKHRHFIDCYPSFKDNILHNNNCDVFMQIYESDDCDEAIRLYSPKKFALENMEDVRTEIKQSLDLEGWEGLGWPRSGFPYQWRNVRRAFNLIPEHNEYDMVLRVRYDIKYIHPINFSDYDSQLLNIPKNGDWLGGINDMIALSSYENMKVYCNLYPYIHQISLDENPELMLRRYLESTSLSIHRITYPIIFRHYDHTGTVYDDMEWAR
jgi:hypothetical protein